MRATHSQPGGSAASPPRASTEVNSTGSGFPRRPSTVLSSSRAISRPQMIHAQGSEGAACHRGGRGEARARDRGPAHAGETTRPAAATCGAPAAPRRSLRRHSGVQQHLPRARIRERRGRGRQAVVRGQLARQLAGGRAQHDVRRVRAHVHARQVTPEGQGERSAPPRSPRVAGASNAAGPPRAATAPRRSRWEQDPRARVPRLAGEVGGPPRRRARPRAPRPRPRAPPRARRALRQPRDAGAPEHAERRRGGTAKREAGEPAQRHGGHEADPAQGHARQAEHGPAGRWWHHRHRREGRDQRRGEHEPAPAPSTSRSRASGGSHLLRRHVAGPARALQRVARAPHVGAQPQHGRRTARTRSAGRSRGSRSHRRTP